VDDVCIDNATQQQEDTGSRQMHRKDVMVMRTRHGYGEQDLSKTIHTLELKLQAANQEIVRLKALIANT
jgi:hypothetical protein